MHGRLEREAGLFNRTFQEGFVDYHENLLFNNIDAFNRKLSQWVVEYNTVIPHHSLNLKPPVQNPRRQRYWTSTPI